MKKGQSFISSYLGPDDISGFEVSDLASSFDMMSHQDFPWYATYNSFKINEEKAIEIIILENGFEEFLNQYQDMVID